MLASSPMQSDHTTPGPNVLQAMTEAGYERFWRDSIAGYADDKVAAGQWLAETAQAQSAAEFAHQLPQGLATPDHHLFEIVDAASSQTVGHLWFAIELRHGVRIAYVYDLAVHPEHQRHGHATRAFRAMEDKVRALNAWRIDLHVFGHNPGAQALYAALGYRVTSVTMAKSL
ncbi:MAG: GNAT family N-acetyltransferase [Vitreoscilla sp.]|nr:GNAT family N-acetyltransferase [Vitreoscilla sp.]MBP6677109.1 GNAT family N-acetyltransferase [Vitreoscilla sp.]